MSASTYCCRLTELQGEIGRASLSEKYQRPNVDQGSLDSEASSCVRRRRMLTRSGCCCWLYFVCVAANSARSATHDGGWLRGGVSKICTEESLQATRSDKPEGLKATEVTPFCVCTGRRSCSPLFASQRRSDLSREAVATKPPSGLNTAF